MILITIQEIFQGFILEIMTETQTFQRIKKHVNVVKVKIIDIVQNNDKMSIL